MFVEYKNVINFTKKYDTIPLACAAPVVISPFKNTSGTLMCTATGFNVHS